MIFGYRRSYKASLGEIAVAFDFGPLAAVSKGVGLHSKENTAYPLYILYENGETFLIYIDLQGRWDALHCFLSTMYIIILINNLYL